MPLHDNVAVHCTALLVLDLVCNPEDRFSHDVAHICALERHRSAVHPCRLISIYRHFASKDLKLGAQP